MAFKTSLSVLTIAVALILPVAAHAQSNAQSNNGRAHAVAVHAVTPRAWAGPLNFNDATMTAFKGRVKANADVAKAWADNLAAADKAVAQTAERAEMDPRKMERSLEPLILAWRMTGDLKYAKTIQAVLLRLCAQSNWVTDKPLLKRDPVWNSDLGMGFDGQIFGRAYSAIRTTLTPAERKTLTNGYIKGVVEPVFGDWIEGSNRIHTLDTMGHNWWAHIVFGAGVGLIGILPDDPRAADYLQRLDRAGAEWWAYQGSAIETKIPTFDSDGGYSESINYADLALNSYLQYRQAWIEMIKEQPAPAPLLGKSLEFFIHNAYPATGTSMSTNFGDGSLTANGGPSLATAWMMGDKRPDYLWYVNLYNPRDNGENLHTIPHFLASLPLPSEPGGKGEAPKLPTSAWYRGMGWATLRSSWDKDATFLAVRSGFTWNHVHADTGSFILFDHGKPLLIDSGNSSYATPEYDQYYRQNGAHNVVTFNGAAEPAEDTYLGSHTPGRIPNMMDADGVKYIFADATGPTSATFARNFRHVLWIDGVILIIDDLKAHEPGQFEWMIHPAGTAKRQGPNLHVVNGDASIDVRPLYPMPFPEAGLPTDYPENMRLVEKSGYEDHDPKTRTTYYAFAPADKSERMKFITAIIPQGVMPVIERLDGKDTIGVRIRKDGKTTDIMLNLKADGSIRHRNATNQLQGWDTDAYLLAVTYAKAGTPDRVFMADGSYLRRDDRVLFDSLSKRFLIADYDDKALRLWLQGQADAELAVRTDGKPLTVNGDRMTAQASGGVVRIACCAAE